MEPASFKDILEKFKQGANSMEEVYSELAYLTTNHDKEIEKLQKQLDNEKARANNEEFVRHEAEKDLENMRKLQSINFSVIVGGLIQKPKEEFEKQLSDSLKKFTATIILLTIVCIGAIIISFYAFKENNISNNDKEVNTVEIEKLINEIKKENNELKEYIKKNLQKPEIQKIIEPAPAIEKKAEEVLIINKPKEEPLEEEKKPIEDTDKEETKTPQKEETTTLTKLDEEDRFLEKILFTLADYDKKYKLAGKNNSRILYKMFLLDLAPFKHDIVLEELKLFAKDYTYVPTEKEIKVWDKQMLYVYTKMLERIKNIPESKITSEMRAFRNYKSNDATVYSGWEYLGDDNLTMKESLEKEIKAIKAQIELNKN